MAAGYYSGRAGTVFPRDYNSRLAQGQSRQWAEGDRFVGEAGPTGQTAVRFTLQVPTPPGPPLPRSGIHHYLGLRTAGGLNIYSVAFTGPFLPATVVAFDMLPDAPPVIRSLVPLRWEWASLLPRVSLSFSPARPLNGSQAIVAADAAQVSLMDILSRIGHAVALVALDGTVLFINTLAREMLAGALNGGRLTAWRRQDQTHLGAALSTLRPGRLSPPVALRRPGGALPILARALPTSAALTGERAALLLFNDPIAPAPSAELNLNLLGLTPAEARIAAQVGRGLTFREAAQVVGVAESTARSTLKSVYSKLGIGKQSELAVIVARLEGFG